MGVNQFQGNDGKENSTQTLEVFRYQPKESRPYSASCGKITKCLNIPLLSSLFINA